MNPTNIFEKKKKEKILINKDDQDPAVYQLSNVFSRYTLLLLYCVFASRQ